MSIFADPFPHSTSELVRRLRAAYPQPAMTPDLMANPFAAGVEYGKHELIAVIENALKRDREAQMESHHGSEAA